MHRPERAFIKGGKRVASYSSWKEDGPTSQSKRPLIKLSSPPDRSIELLYRESWSLMRNRWHARSPRGRRLFRPLTLSLSLPIFFFSSFFSPLSSLSVSLSLPVTREMFNKNSSRASTGRKCRRWGACTARSSGGIETEFHGTFERRRGTGRGGFLDSPHSRRGQPWRSFRSRLARA